MSDIANYAWMASRVYATTEENRLTESSGNWTLESWEPDVQDGFSAGVFRNKETKEIVIYYTGTNADKITDFEMANIPAALGKPSTQVERAIKLYFDVKERYKVDCDVTFVGHSLGGGLAGLMAVYFNKPAFVFDAAPFQASAMETSTINGYWVKFGGRDDAFDLYAREVYRDLGTILRERESRVRSIVLEGEFLQYFRNSENAIYARPEKRVSIGQSDIGPLQRHSMMLLGATQWSAMFLEASRGNSHLVSLLFQEDLYFRDDEKSSERNFLNNALNHEIRSASD